MKCFSTLQYLLRLDIGPESDWSLFLVSNVLLTFINVVLIRSACAVIWPRSNVPTQLYILVRALSGITAFMYANNPNMNWFCSFFLELLLLLLSEYFTDKTLELFHRPKPKHEKSLSQYWLCKYCLPNKLDRPRINIEFFSYTTIWRASPLISCGSSPHFWGSFQTHRATRKKGCISICNVNKMSRQWIKEKEKCWYHIQEWLS